MSSLPHFPNILNQQTHDDLWQWAQHRFSLDLHTWQPLWLNGLSLGHLNEKWRDLIKQDWQNDIHENSDGLFLYSRDWTTLANNLQSMTLSWNQRGLLNGWRNESFDVCNASGAVLFSLERSAFRPLGLRSHAVHLNGLSYQNEEWHFWIGKRSEHKIVDPNKLDNIVGGGIASGESILEAIWRESEEEAGLSKQIKSTFTPTNCLHSLHSVSRGLHNEILHIFDVILPKDIQPKNQDGEVAEFYLMNTSQLIQAMLNNRMMNDAQLVTLDALHRYHALNPTHPLSSWLNSLQHQSYSTF